MAPFRRPEKFNQDPDAVFGCPCGRTGSYGSILAHRHGYQLRPDCHGAMIDFAPPPAPEVTPRTRRPRSQGTPGRGGESLPPAPPGSADSVTSPSDDDAPELPPKPTAYEADPLDELDEEEVARQLNLRRGITADPANLSWWQDAQRAEPPSDGEHGGGSGGGGDEDQPGDLRQVPPVFPAAPSQARESVVLPVQVRLMYDWMRGQGWHQGQGSLSDWVTDIVMDHWKYCLGKGIFILDREEVMIA